MKREWFIRNNTDGLPSNSKSLNIEQESNGIRSIICEIKDFSICEEHGEILEIARLIKSAPDLFQALKDVVDLLKMGSTLDPIKVVRNCRQVINYVEGK